MIPYAVTRPKWVLNNKFLHVSAKKYCIKWKVVSALNWRADSLPMSFPAVAYDSPIISGINTPTTLPFMSSHNSIPGLNWITQDAIEFHCHTNCLDGWEWGIQWQTTWCLKNHLEENWNFNLEGNLIILINKIVFNAIAEGANPKNFSKQKTPKKPACFNINTILPGMQMSFINL